MSSGMDMRVVLEHRQEVTGLGSQISQFVDCTVQFSEEEKAIIRVRGLYNHIIVADPSTPPPSRREFMAAGILQGFAPLFALMGFALTVFGVFKVFTSPFPTAGGFIPLGLFLLLGSPVGWAVGFLMDRSMDIRFKHPKQHISVGTYACRSVSPVYAPDPAHSDLVVDDIKERLTFLKQTIAGSADLRQRQSQEL